MRRSIGMFALLASTAIAVASCSTTPIAPHVNDAPDLSRAKKVALWATYYGTPVVREDRRRGIPLLDMSGRALGAKLAVRDFCDAAMQGSVRVVDRKGAITMYQFAATVSDGDGVDCTAWYPKHPAIGRSRFMRSKGGLCRGARGDELVPFKSIATDPRHIPYGSLVYVPALRGKEIVLESGERIIHDGYLQAEDHGGAVKGNHIDVFIGMEDTNPLDFVKSAPEHTFEAYVISKS